MKRFALVMDGRLYNLAMADDADAFKLVGYEAVVELADDSPVEIGWDWDGGTDFVPHVPTTLEDAQSIKSGEIEARTKELLEGGFGYLDQSFGLRDAEQVRLTQLKAFANTVKYPVVYPDESGKGITLKDEAEAQAFLDAGVTRAGYILVGGEELLGEVRAATTIAEVEAIVDKRK